ncbi:DUF397 domain-containing protein [Spongiactinospora rosea]|uniref:DUF397 domain-containing protein n=1 Tax=Spongiactinospora rosea TaxID=2248750 RepID=A0A366LXA0_9ACTN|nr:DUF397 domain-containing protein [Spongiactinospora rosea]RBQ18551.1 DUF397 domain-containing protein [Spongiactinospora rosea]
MEELDLSQAVWHKATASGIHGQCVEVATNLPGTIAIRDSKDPTGPVLLFAPAEWTAFLNSLK